MVRIDIDINKIIPLYKNSPYGNAWPLTKKLNRRITNHLNPDAQVAYQKGNSASEIVSQFLRAVFPKTYGEKLTDDDLCVYLRRNDFEEIILSFWNCVGEVWSRKLASNEGVTITLDKEDVLNLSYWNGAKQHVEEQSDPHKRKEIIASVITDKLKDFFVFDFEGKQEISITDYKQFIDTVVNKSDVFKTVKFRYEQDLFMGKTTNDSTKKWGALEILSYIFNYGWLTESSPAQKATLRHRILSNIYAPVCPYCNRQYVTLFEDTSISADKSNDDTKDTSKTTADLDHFYIKSAYPFLALSAYNFVPSCQICNSRFKLTMDFHYRPHLYPYREKAVNEITFELQSPLLMSEVIAWKDREKWITQKGLKIVNVIATEGNLEAENSVSTFHLNEVYQSHVDYVYELIWKATQYPDSKLEEIHNMFPELLSNTEEAKEMIFGQYLTDNELHKRPLCSGPAEIAN